MALSLLVRAGSKCRALATLNLKLELFTSAAAFSSFKFSPGLETNAFWKKKFRRAVVVRDIDGDGLITRSDFQRIVELYKEMGSSGEHLRKLNDTMIALCNSCGLTDDSKSLTYDEFTKNWIASLYSTSGEIIANRFANMYVMIDMDGDGVISFSEWVKYCKTIDVDPEHARLSFDAMDTDGSNTISKEEFLAYNHEFFYSTEDTLNSSILFGPLD